MKKATFIPLKSFSTTASPLRNCDHEECEKSGEFRAPKSPTQLREYYWFCLDHIKEYNKTWDFYRGMSPEEIEESRISDVTWNRPSWPVGGWRTLLENAKYLDGIDPLYASSLPSSPSLPREVQRASKVLNVSVPISLNTLKKKYKILVKRHHPDLNGGDKNEEDQFKKVNEAYHILLKYLKGEPE